MESKHKKEEEQIFNEKPRRLTKINKEEFQAFRCLLLGRYGVGKTYNDLKWALDLFKQKIFNPRRVILISATWKSDPSQKEFISYCQEKYKGFKQHNCFEEIGLELLRKLYDTQKMIKDTQPQKLKNWLLAFDDQVSSSLIKRQDKDPIMKDLFCKNRHQIYPMLYRFKSTIDPTCRDQFTIIAVFRQGNKKALLELLADYDESKDIDFKKTIKQLYEWYIESVESNNSHGSFVINVLTDYGKGKYQKNLVADKYFDQ